MARSAARRTAVALPEWIRPQLTQLVQEAPEGPDWLYEIKFDGYHMHARLDRGAVRRSANAGTVVENLDPAGDPLPHRRRSKVQGVPFPMVIEPASESEATVPNRLFGPVDRRGIGPTLAGSSTMTQPPGTFRVYPSYVVNTGRIRRRQ